ncbi:hypothetical protein Pint_21527 [Pistacia integerrima]|uniref:Uncharacterized protein n=1 Tax=Pistacia integerrima TaxID=434235 RepID=A0ACC0XA89_9ROSI|nr:hypothetical protein Pint_21527 [Pistacia integerrima]
MRCIMRLLVQLNTITASASSLRYYGLGLENGNYTLTLQFAEIADLDTTGRRSLGRRVFDIYVQACLHLQITLAKKASPMHHTGTCCMPTMVHMGPLISAISAAPVRPPGGRSPITKKNRTGFLLVGGCCISVTSCNFLHCPKKKKKATKLMKAWHLYENNRQLELVDSKLSIFSEEEVISLIWGSSFVYLDIALIEASDVHVIAMLCGDIEVSAVNSKPGYLTEWTFDDAASYVTDDTAEEFDDTGEECDDTSNYISSTSLSRVDKTPQRSATKALLH